MEKLPCGTKRKGEKGLGRDKKEPAMPSFYLKRGKKNREYYACQDERGREGTNGVPSAAR